MQIGLDVTVLHDYQKTGIGVYTYNLINALLKLDKTDNFSLFGVGNFTSIKYLNELPFNDQKNVITRFYKIPSRLFRTTFNLWQKVNYPKINSLLGEVDLFHSFNYYLPPQDLGRVVATVYDLTPLTSPKWHHPKTVQMEKLRLERINQQADLVIAISESTKQDFLKLYPGKRIEVIYPGVSEIFLKVPDEKTSAAVLKKYQLEPGYFISVSTLEPRKNLMTLVKAYLKGNFTQSLVLVGKVGWGEKLITDNPKIRVLGYIPEEDLPSLYNQSTALIYPSLYEGFGIPPLEAMCSGAAVICSNSSSLPEACGEAALYFDPKSEEELLKSMKIMIEDKKLRQELIAKGHKQSKKFDWQKSANMLLKLYHEFS